MSKKLFAVSLIIVVAAAGLTLNQVSAKNDKNSDSELPTEEGVYSVPGRADLKLRVFVHKEKRNNRPNPTTKVCGLADPDSTAAVSQIVINQAGLHLPSGTWTYVLNTKSVPASVGSSNLAKMAGDAFARWQNAIDSSAQISFVKSANTTYLRNEVLDGRNIIAWGATDAGTLAITYVWYYPDSGLLAETDTIMNKNVSWAWSNPATWGSSTTTCAYMYAYDAQDILTHELGHWLGLSDEYDYANYGNATMYGYGSPMETLKDSLTAGDIAGLGLIY